MNLPEGEYVVFGSGPLAANGIREAKDVDLLVSESLYQNLRKSGWVEVEDPISGKHIAISGVEAWVENNQSLTKLLKEADIIEGVTFVCLNETLRWKVSMGREKDLADVELIKKHLDKH